MGIHSAESLIAKKNPFALIALACRKALLEKIQIEVGMARRRFI